MSAPIFLHIHGGRTLWVPSHTAGPTETKPVHVLNYVTSMELSRSFYLFDYPIQLVDDARQAAMHPYAKTAQDVLVAVNEFRRVCADDQSFLLQRCFTAHKSTQPAEPPSSQPNAHAGVAAGSYAATPAVTPQQQQQQQQHTAQANAAAAQTGNIGDVLSQLLQQQQQRQSGTPEANVNTYNQQPALDMYAGGSAAGGGGGSGVLSAREVTTSAGMLSASTAGMSGGQASFVPGVTNGGGYMPMLSSYQQQQQQQTQEQALFGAYGGGNGNAVRGMGGVAVGGYAGSPAMMMMGGNIGYGSATGMVMGGGSGSGGRMPHYTTSMYGNSSNNGNAGGSGGDANNRSRFRGGAEQRQQQTQQMGPFGGAVRTEPEPIHISVDIPPEILATYSNPAQVLVCATMPGPHMTVWLREHAPPTEKKDPKYVFCKGGIVLMLKAQGSEVVASKPVELFPKQICTHFLMYGSCSRTNCLHEHHTEEQLRHLIAARHVELKALTKKQRHQLIDEIMEKEKIGIAKAEEERLERQRQRAEAAMARRSQQSYSRSQASQPTTADTRSTMSDPATQRTGSSAPADKAGEGATKSASQEAQALPSKMSLSDDDDEDDSESTRRGTAATQAVLSVAEAEAADTKTSSVVRPGAVIEGVLASSIGTTRTRRTRAEKLRDLGVTDSDDEATSSSSSSSSDSKSSSRSSSKSRSSSSRSSSPSKSTRSSSRRRRQEATVKRDDPKEMTDDTSKVAEINEGAVVDKEEVKPRGASETPATPMKSGDDDAVAAAGEVVVEDTAVHAVNMQAEADEEHETAENEAGAEEDNEEGAQPQAAEKKTKARKAAPKKRGRSGTTTKKAVTKQARSK